MRENSKTTCGNILFQKEIEICFNLPLSVSKYVNKVSDTIDRLQTKSIKFEEIYYNLVHSLFLSSRITLCLNVILILICLIRRVSSDNLCLLKYQLLVMTYLMCTVCFFCEILSFFHEFLFINCRMTTSAEKNYCYHCGSCNVKNPNKYNIC